MKITTHRQVVPTLRMHGALLSLPHIPPRCCHRPFGISVLDALSLSYREFFYKEGMDVFTTDNGMYRCR